jgi:hypothetical protein
MRHVMNRGGFKKGCSAVVGAARRIVARPGHSPANGSPCCRFCSPPCRPTTRARVSRGDRLGDSRHRSGVGNSFSNQPLQPTGMNISASLASAGGPAAEGRRSAGGGVIREAH